MMFLYAGKRASSLSPNRHANVGVQVGDVVFRFRELVPDFVPVALHQSVRIAAQIFLQCAGRNRTRTDLRRGELVRSFGRYRR